MRKYAIVTLVFVLTAALLAGCRGRYEVPGPTKPTNATHATVPTNHVTEPSTHAATEPSQATGHPDATAHTGTAEPTGHTGTTGDTTQGTEETAGARSAAPRRNR